MSTGKAVGLNFIDFRVIQSDNQSGWLLLGVRTGRQMNILGYVALYVTNIYHRREKQQFTSSQLHSFLIRIHG